MSLSGRFDVSPAGAATYTLPLQVPPGTAGIEPKLSLTYSSQSGSGLLGVGWGLGGLSAIGRCPQTVAQDGVRGGVNLDASDRYCLDGQRLMAVSGAYGANGTEYRTERESFARIVSYGTAGNGPAWFQVWTKSGLIMKYGITADSRIEAQGKTTVRVWALKKLENTKGNYLTVVYTEDSVNGDYYPSRIDYTGNANGLAPNNSVRFVYEARPDVMWLDLAGSKIKNSVRLARIQTYAGSTIVKDYRLAYGQSVTTKRSRIVSMTECGVDANNQTKCLAPMTLGWGEPQVGPVNLRWTGGHGVGNAGGQLADLFGDGRLVYYTHSLDGTHYATRLNADGTLQNWKWTGGHGVGDAGDWQLGDLFGEGRQVYFTHSNDGTFYVTGLKSDGVVQGWKWTNGYAVADAGWQLGDLFGDGRQVYYTHSNSGIHWAARMNPDRTLNKWVWRSWGVGDSGWQLGNLFGDGRQVYYTHSADGTHWAARLNADGTVQNWKWTGGVGVGDAGWQLVDLFGDGRQVYYTHSTDGIHWAMRLNADGTMEKWMWTGGHGVGNAGWQMGDLFGDGRQVYYTHSAEGIHWATRFSSAPPDMLIGITTGLGATITLAYKPLTAASVYTKDTNAVYPQLDLQAPLYVVSSVTSGNGVGGRLTTNYTYGAAKVDLNGRGFLGYRWTRATQAETGLSTLISYMQDWPYTGLPSIARKYTTSGGNNGVLSVASTTYGCNDFVSSSGCSVAPGRRYFPYVSQSVENGWDLNGTALPGVVTLNQFDAWGNATQITVRTTDGHSKTTTNTYNNDSTTWHLGRLIRSQVQSVAP